MVEVASTIVNLADPKRDMMRFEPQLVSAAARVIQSGYYINGGEVGAFEDALGKLLGQHQPIVGVGSGTDALILSLLALGVGPGDEVIVPSHTAGPSVAAIRAVHGVPVFVDVEADTACLNAQLVEEALSARTKALLVVHLYGHPADLDRLLPIARAKGIPLIEDCAQAQGAFWNGKPVGTIGDIGCFSFYPTKNLGAIGDGGGVAGGKEILEKLRKLRTYGWSSPQFSEIALGRCSRLDEMQAAFLNVKLPHLADDVSARRRIAGLYREGLAELPIRLPAERPGAAHAYHLFVIQSDRRDALRTYLAERGVMTGLHYPYPAHVQPGLMEGSRTAGSLEVTEKLRVEILSLPMFVTMTDEEVARVVQAVRSFFGGDVR